MNSTMRYGLLVLLMLPPMLRAQPMTDAATLAEMLRPVAAEAAARSPAGAVHLSVLPEHAPVLVTQIFSEELQKRDRTVSFRQAENRSSLTVDVREMHSSAVSSGKSSYFRRMNVTLGILLRDYDAGQVSWSREFQLARTDTLDGDAPYTRRSWLDDHGSFWNDLFEPLLVTASAVVIAILLFTVRGS